MIPSENINPKNILNRLIAITTSTLAAATTSVAIPIRKGRNIEFWVTIIPSFIPLTLSLSTNIVGTTTAGDIADNKYLIQVLLKKVNTISLP